MNKFILTIPVILGLCGCVAGVPEDAQPLDLIAKRTQFAAQFPDANGASLDVANKGSFEMFNNGNAVFEPSRSSNGLRTSTRVESLTNNQVCLAKSGGWSGVCIDVYQRADGSLFCSGTFGNGAGFNNACQIRALRPSS